MKRFWLASAVCCLGLAVGAGGLLAYVRPYGFHVLLRHGGTYWRNVSMDSPHLSPAMRLALAKDPVATPGEYLWRIIGQGFEVADLPVLVEGQEVDRIQLARIDPARFRFAVRTAPAGDRDLDNWMARLGAALVVNGSYFSRDGEPATPLLSAGSLLGPSDYDAKAGAFVATSSSTTVHDLAREDWHAAFKGADDAMVSYPLLLADGAIGVKKATRWLANRSFIGQDKAGWIVVGTTEDGFFSLDRLARFLRDAPLGLALALNLDGGPVACQGISLNGFERKTYGRWELQADDEQAKLLTWPYGTVAMPVVLAVFAK